MKTLTTILLMTLSLTAQAATQQSETLLEKKAISQSGFGKYNFKPTACTYFVVKNEEENGRISINIFVNSDQESFINGRISLDPKQIPLQEGVIVSERGYKLSYVNGTLRFKETETDEGLLNNDYELTEVVVSPDLMDVKSAHVKKATKALIREITDVEMDCDFSR